MAFLYVFFGKGGMPMIDFANTCGSDHGTFPGTDLADCSFLETDIKACQAKGKLVTLSLGGGTSKVGLSSDSEANSFAENIWNMFLGGNSNIRPLGNAVLDGLDLDIESGSPAHYATFVNKIRSLATGANKRYYITAAPQCPFPDANIGDALNGASFDAVYVQFYNNFCETSAPSEFNFATWDNWAKTTSPNRDIKVFLGAPGAKNAAGDGYVDINTLSSVAVNAQKKYSSFGGVMLWDADEAHTNNRYDLAIKNAIRQGPSPAPPATTTHKATSTIAKPASTHTASAHTQAPIITPSETPTATAEASTSSFRDPRATARVRRPTFTPAARNELNESLL